MPDETEDVGEPRIVSKTERNAATSQRDNAEGPPKQVEPKQGRPNDYEIKVHEWALENSTLAGRAKQAAKRRDAKQVSKDDGQAENKQVSKRAAAKK
jgi:hypothetical protein